jgi:type IV secretion system protein VirB5
MQSTMKSFVVAACLSVSASVYAGGIPTIDAAAIAQMVQQYQQMEKDYQMYKDQLTQLEQQLKAVTGGRGLANSGMDDAFSDYLPEDWQETFQGILSGQFSGAAADAAVLIRQAGYCKDLTGDMKARCETKAVFGLVNVIFYSGAFEAAKQRGQQIEDLMKKAGQTQDAKEIAEMQARIQAEQALLQNEQTKMDMFSKVSASTEQSLDDANREEMKSFLFGNGSKIQYEPIKW